MTARSILRVAGVLVGVLAVVLAAGAAQTARAAPSPDGVVPPTAKVAGRTLGDWGGDWWTWTLAQPPASNPIMDSTGEYCDVDQPNTTHGNVWFLAGNFGGPTVRTCTIPAQKYLFMPLFNSTWWLPDDVATMQYFADTYDWDDNPYSLTDEELLRLTLDYQNDPDKTYGMSLTIDGTPISRDWETDFRGTSDVFKFRLDEQLCQAFGYSAGCGGKKTGMSDGYWVMLEPLSSGDHTINFTSARTADDPDEGPFGAFELDVTYNLTVK